MKILYEKKPHDFYYRNDTGRKHPLKCPAHLHHHVEIIYLREGYVKAFVDSDAYEMSSGDLLFAFPNKIHRFEDREGENVYDLWIINPDLTPELAEIFSMGASRSAVIKNAAENPRIPMLLEILRKTGDFPISARGNILKGYLLSFFSELIEMMPIKENPKNDEAQSMRALVKYCSKNFTKELSLSLLAKDLHLSKYYISHLFGDKLGIKFNDYINYLRVSEACRMLRATDMSMTDISDASGFGTLRTFNRAFTKQMGISPSEYRRSNKDEMLELSLPMGDVGATLTDQIQITEVRNNI